MCGRYRRTRRAVRIRVKTLSIGGTGCSLTEVRCESQFMVVVDDMSASFGVGLIANVERLDTTEFVGRDSRTGVGHLGNTEIDGVAKHGG